MDSKKELTHNNEKKASSRFSRRRFIQAVSTTSPLLLSVKSPIAWASKYGTIDGSIAAYLMNSANASRVQYTYRSQPPEYWINTYNGNNQVVEKELNILGRSATTKLFDVLPLFNSWQSSSGLNSDWEFMRDDLYQPTLFQALTDQTNELTIKFRNNSLAKEQVVNLQFANFYPNLATALLNSQFSQAPIDYLDEMEVIGHIDTQIEELIDHLLSDIINEEVIDTHSMKNLKPIETLYSILVAWYD